MVINSKMKCNFYYISFFYIEVNRKIKYNNKNFSKKVGDKMEPNFIFNLINNVEINIKIIKSIFIIIVTYYTNFKINNRKENTNIKKLSILIIFALMCSILKYVSTYFISTMASILVITFIYSKDDIKRGILTTIISMSINYMISVASIAISFVIVIILKITNNYINLIIILISHWILIMMFFKIKKFKYGLNFLQKSKKNEYIDLFILNISVMILFSTIIFTEFYLLKAMNIAPGILLYVVIMFITIHKSIQLYYKQKLLEQDLTKTKEELANKIKDNEELEKENIEISKKAHTLDHKQKSLAHKIDEMMMKAEISKEESAEVRERLNEIGRDLYKEKNITQLTLTDIPEIDDMLKFMQSECIANKIDFQLQLKGNIHYMINNLITKQDLETLLADHIKNAIIAINHTENINRSILVKLGKIDETYGLYIYDSGIEFEKETLENLGKKPSTTHKDEGGTGMGFMNTFDTMRKCKASLVIEEIGKPNKDNYTKAIKIKFDNKNEFKVETFSTL